MKKFEKEQELHRSQDNQQAFDELTLEEAVTMSRWGLDFECNDGRVSKIIEHY